MMMVVLNNRIVFTTQDSETITSNESLIVFDNPAGVSEPVSPRLRYDTISATHGESGHTVMNTIVHNGDTGTGTGYQKFIIHK